MYPTNFDKIAEVIREDLLREAEKQRLIRIAKTGMPTLIDRIKIKLCIFLPKLSEHLQINIQPISTSELNVKES